MANGAAARIKKREATWRRVVAGYGRSGMSVRAYCAKHGVKEPVFYWWRAKLARRDATKPMEAFVPVVVQPTESGHVEGITIELRGGRVLRLPAMPVSQVVELVRVIEGMA